MNKLLLIVIVLLYSNFLIGQKTLINITNFSHPTHFDDGACHDIFTISFKNKNGKSFEIVTYKGAFENGLTTANGSFLIEGIVDELIVFIDAKDESGGSCSRDRQHRYETFTKDVFPRCYTGFFKEKVQAHSDLTSEVIFNYQVIPMPTISRGKDIPEDRFLTNIAGFDDDLSVYGNDDYDTSVYKWQYGFIDGTERYICGGTIRPRFCERPRYVWRDIPRSPTRILTIKPSAFLNRSDIGKEVFFRTISCGEGSDDFTSYKIRESAPHIVSIATKDVSCYDATDEKGDYDGEITITFDRALKPGAQVGFSITDSGNNSNVRSTPSISKFNVSDKVHKIIGLPGGNREFILKVLGDENYFSDGINHEERYRLRRPEPVEFTNDIQKDVTNVWCHGGDDGIIPIKARGGTNGGYMYRIKTKEQEWSDPTIIWMPFTNRYEHNITRLNSTTKILAGTYHIQIRDGNGCNAKEIGPLDRDGNVTLGEIITKEITIDQPSNPLKVRIENINDPRAYGFEDGRIQAFISGGTAYPDGSYDFVWTDENDVPVTTTNTRVEGDDFVVVLHSIGKGEYTIEVKDRNFTPATNKAGCTITSDSFTLNEPDPLQVNIEIETPISCNITNEYSDGRYNDFPYDLPDQFHDGVLVATVTGGVPFDRTRISSTEPCRLPLRGYCYTWRKDVGGIKQELYDDVQREITDSIARHQSVGNYSLNVIDANGIELGEYDEYFLPDGSREYRLVRHIDSLKYLPQPEKLTVSFTTTPVVCSEGNNGTALAIVNGGIPPFTYEWSTGETTSKIENLISGKYTVQIIDAMGCEVKGSTIVDQPNGLQIEDITTIAPTCFEGSDGVIEVAIRGGVTPYRLQWNTGARTNRIDNLTQGTYIIEVIDANDCKAFHEVVLTDPDPVVVNMPEKRALCADQTLALDITIEDAAAIYSWVSDNGFVSNSSTVELTEPGTYTATITSSLGCVGVGSIEVEVSNTPIDADFLITTQAYTNQEIILINVSEPIGEKIEWTMPDGAEVISQSDDKLVLKFAKEGPYDILLTSHQGDCYEEYTKTIVVQPAIESPEDFNASGEFIEEFIVFPNPNDGTFKTKISLAEDTNVTVKIVNLMSGAVMDERTEKNQKELLLDYSIALPTGVYLMLLETPKGSETRKLIFE